MFPAAEFALLEQSIADMVSSLDQASNQSQDPLQEEPLIVAFCVQQPGRRGRPRLEFDPAFLAAALELRGPTGIASVFRCSSRTVHRRAVDYGLLEPGEPVYTDHLQPDGTIQRSYRSSTRPVSVLTDEQPDTLVANILQTFPMFGRLAVSRLLGTMFLVLVSRSLMPVSMGVLDALEIGQSIAGHTKCLARILSGTMMVNMVCDMLSSIGSAPHTLYFVLLALIRWKLIQHGFVDGHSRFVVGIRVHNNNRAETVLLLFHVCRARHGTPSRVRGDHGTENIRVAEWMEQHQGARWRVETYQMRTAFEYARRCVCRTRVAVPLPLAASSS